MKQSKKFHILSSQWRAADAWLRVEQQEKLVYVIVNKKKSLFRKLKKKYIVEIPVMHSMSPEHGGSSF